MSKKFVFLANVKDLSQHCVPKKDKNECFVKFKLGAYKRMGESFSGLVLKFGKETWDQRGLKDVLLPRGVYRITIEQAQIDLMGFLEDKQKDAVMAKRDESVYYLLQEHPAFIPNVLRFILNFYEMATYKDWEGKERVRYRLDLKQTYRYEVVSKALDDLIEENAFAEWSEWDLRWYAEYGENIRELIKKKKEEAEEKRERQIITEFIDSLVKVFSYPIKSALIARFDEMQDGMDELQETIKKATKKKKRKRKKRS